MHTPKQQGLYCKDTQEHGPPPISRNSHVASLVPALVVVAIFLQERPKPLKVPVTKHKGICPKPRLRPLIQTPCILCVWIPWTLREVQRVTGQDANQHGL